MILYIYPNVGFAPYRSGAVDAVRHFGEVGITCAVAPEYCSFFEGAGARCDISPSGCDYICSVGGDGSMLHASQLAISVDKPIFGLNMGRLGFLSALEFSSLKKIDEGTINELEITPRTLLELRLPDGKILYAVNDIVASKSDPARTVDLCVEYGDDCIADWRADGVIIATPTGSTAYSLSAGGPVVTPNLDLMLVTPICPHNGSSRSIVLDGSLPLRIIPAKRAENTAAVSVDGKYACELSEGFMETRVSPKKLKMMSSKEHSFYYKFYQNNSERERPDEIEKTSDDN